MANEHDTFTHKDTGIEFYRVPAHLVHLSDALKASGCSYCDIWRHGLHANPNTACTDVICTAGEAARNGLSGHPAIYLTKQNFLDFRLTGHIPGESS